MEKREKFEYYAKRIPFVLMVSTFLFFAINIACGGFILFVAAGTCTSILFFLSLIPYVIACRRSILWLLFPLFIGGLEFCGFVFSRINMSDGWEAVAEAINTVFVVPNFIIYLATYAAIAALLEGPVTTEEAGNICEYIGTVLFLAAAALIIINVILKIINKIKSKSQKAPDDSQPLSPPNNNI